MKGFRLSGIEYELCFAAKDRKFLMLGEDIQALALVLASITAGLAALMCRMVAIQAYALVDMVPVLLYGSLFAVAFLPWPLPFPNARLFCLRTVQRVLLPLQVGSWKSVMLFSNTDLLVIVAGTEQ